MWVKYTKGSGFTAWSPHADLMGKGDKLCTGKPGGGGEGEGLPGGREPLLLSIYLILF